MVGFSNVKTYVNCCLSSNIITSWRKQPSVVTAAGYWMDLSMSPGNPSPNYYASIPLIGRQLAQSTNGGIFHGAAASPSSLYLKELMAMTTTAGAVPLTMLLCDYLLYYPFIDEAVTVPQIMDVDVTPAVLPRYTTGENVQMIAVVVAGHVGSPVTTFYVNYTNSNGDPGRTSRTVQLNVGQFVNGTILTTAPATIDCFGPFIPLQAGDTGIRSIQSVTINGGGDVGLFTLVLVRPLVNISLRGIDAPTEVDYLINRSPPPQIIDNAYLNFLALPAGSLTGAPIHGLATFVWS